MPRLLVVILVLLSAVLSARSESEGLPSARNKTYHGYYYFLDEKGDTTLMLVINNVTVFPPERFKNKEREQFYWRMVRDVRKGLPYAKLISATVIETYEYMETLPNKKAKDKHIKEVEKGLKKQYTARLKKLTFRQGKLLIKLVDRECNQSSYELVKAFMGPFKAGFYQAFASLFGASLKKEYDPDNDDKLVERVIELVENGQL